MLKPVPWSTCHWYVGAVVRPAFTVKVVLEPSQMVLSTGSSAITGLMFTVRVAAFDGISGAHSPLISTRYCVPFMPAGMFDTNSVSLVTPLYVALFDRFCHVPLKYCHWYPGSVVTPGFTTKMASSFSQMVTLAGCMATSGFSLIYSLAGFDVASGVQVPLTTTR